MEPKKNVELQALRGYAIILVVLFHTALCVTLVKTTFWGADFLDWVGGGTGVDLFFALSGFVVTKSYIRLFGGVRPTSTHYYSFITRRFLRIFIPGVAWLLFVLVLELFFNRHSNFGLWKYNIPYAVSVIFQVSNFWKTYVDTHNNGGIFGYYWSLSLEQQFYIIFPLLFLLPSFVRNVGMLGVTAFFLYANAGFGTNYGDIFRSDSMFLGVMIALYNNWLKFPRFGSTSGGRLIFKIVATLLMILFPLWIGVLRQYVPLQCWGLTALSGAALVYLASYEQGYIFPSTRMRNMLASVGDVSFSVYLCHLPIIWLTEELYEDFGLSSNPNIRLPIVIFVAWLLTAIFSFASYRYVEMPAQRYAHSKSKRILANIP